MGQYYKAVNLDKREKLDQFQFGVGLKLMASCYVGNPFNDALTHLLANDWHGDRVLFCGDYAWECKEGRPWEKTLRDLTDGDPYQVAESFRDRSGDFAAAKYDSPFVESAEERSGEVEAPTLRYVFNETLGVYYDRAEAPVDSVYWCKGEPKITRTDPLTIFMALGNDLGSGDYRASTAANMGLVGTWAGHVIGAAEVPPAGMAKIDCPFDINGIYLTAPDEAIREAMASAHLDWADTTLPELSAAVADLDISDGLAELEASTRGVADEGHGTEVPSRRAGSLR